MKYEDFVINGFQDNHRKPSGLPNDWPTLAKQYTPSSSKGGIKMKSYKSNFWKVWTSCFKVIDVLLSVCIDNDVNVGVYPVQMADNIPVWMLTLVFLSIVNICLPLLFSHKILKRCPNPSRMSELKVQDIFILNCQNNNSYHSQ